MAFNPVTLEIVKNALAAAAEEMGVAVVRGAYSTLIKEGGDATSAIFDNEGRLVAQSRGAPLMHLSSLRPSLRELLVDFPRESMRDGDAYIFNDPYRGGIHSNDIMLFRPVFVDGKLTFFTTALVHVADVGGISAGGLPANATEMYHEGLILPPVKLYDAGKPNESLIKIIGANSRTPEKVLGDVYALLAAANVGAVRLAALVERYGREELLEACGDLMDYSERRMRLEIEKIPAGVCEGAFVIDDDGIDSEKSYTVRTTLRIEGSTLQADFSGTDAQSRGPINAAYSQSMSGVLFALRCFVDPTIPMNDGCYRPIEVNLPRGTLVNPNPPAACNSRMATVMAIVEAMVQAFSKHYPERAVAASSNVHVYTMNSERESGRVWTFMDAQYGGVGARSSSDGLDSTGPLIFGGNRGFHTIEAFEMEYPVRFERFEYWRDSGGAGRYRGGLGIRRDVRMLEDGQLTGRATDRCRFPPPGVFGGERGAGGGWVVNMGAEDEAVLAPKVTGYPLRAGDTVTMLTSGGGGVGPAWERYPGDVLDDVRDGRVSIAAARERYGVVIDEEAFEVDETATAALRRSMGGG